MGLRDYTLLDSEMAEGRSTSGSPAADNDSR